MVKTAILVPCYNEELTIGRVIQDFQQVLPHAQIYCCWRKIASSSSLIALISCLPIRTLPRVGFSNPAS